MTNKSILVVEDDPLLRLDMVTLLTEAGLEVEELDSADSAMAVLYERADDLGAVLTDIQMPGTCDGLQLAEIVSRHWPHIFVLLCSGHLRPMIPLPSNVRFLQKPLRPLEVLTAMQDATAV